MHKTYRNDNPFESNLLGKSLLNNSENFLGILDIDLKLIFSNEIFFKTHTLFKPVHRQGMTLSEVLGCSEAQHRRFHCILDEKCSECSLNQTLYQAISQKENRESDIDFSHINNDFEGVLYKVKVEFNEFENNSYLFIYMINLAKNAHNHLMERVFYHDALNSIAATVSMINLLELEDFTDQALGTYLPLLKYHSNEVLEQIRFQRKLSLTEYGCDSVSIAPFNLSDIVYHNVRLYNFLNNLENKEKNIKIGDFKENISMNSDETLVGRIVHNLIKNAEEAVCPGEIIDVNLFDEGEYVKFTVSNPGEIPEHIKPKMFKKIVSTKQKHRGLGTYSMKYLSTKLLKGSISFVSENNRTEFTLVLLKNLP